MSDAGAVGGNWRTLGWRRQRFWDKAARTLGLATASDARRWTATTALRVLGLSMIVGPVIAEVEYACVGVILVSPPLIAMFLAGFVGLGLSQAKYWRRVSLSDVFDREAP